ncbi:MAG: acyltransferase [Chitinophagaceae bacterium]|nr:MAG: acyltransferase [Chitinophagaceae bacterium]
MSKSSYKFRYVPALDGIRGVAVITVMFFHSSVLNLQGGFLGVDIFFVLSGFLISTLILKEFNEAGTLNFRNFYIRRALRLMPAMLLVLFSLWAAVLVFGNKFGTTPTTMFSSTIYTLFYSANWVVTFGLAPWPAAIVHFWSLAIEEQFYLLWPIAFFILLKQKVKPTSIVQAILVLVLILTSWRIFLWTTEHNFARVYFATDTRLNSLFIGCLLAIAVSNDLVPAALKRYSTLILGTSLCVLLPCLFYMNNGSNFTYFVGFELAAIVTTGMIVGVLYGHNFFTRFFEQRFLVWFGKLSYGIYLWHGVTFYFFEKVDFPFKEYKPVLFISQFGSSLLAATFSYYFVEKYFLRLKGQFGKQRPEKKSVLQGVTT